MSATYLAIVRQAAKTWSRAASSTLNPLVLVTRNSSSINHRALYQPMHTNACSAVLMSCEVSRRHSTGGAVGRRTSRGGRGLYATGIQGDVVPFFLAGLARRKEAYLGETQFHAGRPPLAPVTGGDFQLESEARRHGGYERGKADAAIGRAVIMRTHEEIVVIFRRVLDAQHMPYPRAAPHTIRRDCFYQVFHVITPVVNRPVGSGTFRRSPVAAKDDRTARFHHVVKKQGQAVPYPHVTPYTGKYCCRTYTKITPFLQIYKQTVGSQRCISIKKMCIMGGLLGDIIQISARKEMCPCAHSSIDRMIHSGAR